MARFVLIDHSLQEPGGHNYEYAVDVLEAAEAMGYEPALAANHKFQAPSELPAHWRVLPVFKFPAHSNYCLHPRGRNRYPHATDGRRLAMTRNHSGLAPFLHAGTSWLARVRDDLHFGARRVRMDDFARSCAQLWHGLSLCREDRVFFPTLFDFDLLGLVRFLKDVPATKHVDWHLQFQFDIFTGRPPQYAKQGETLSRFQSQFSAALAQIPDHRVHFYADTELLADQYNRLGVADFQVLPWPVNRRFREGSERGLNGPLRVTCPGTIRREKGKHEICRLVRALWADFLVPGKIQLLFQGRAKDLRRWFPKEALASASFSETGDTCCQAPVVIVRHPLETDDYTRFIRNADVGLFLYDAQRYYARCSGILVEMLSAGVPVIVPAGCWLAEQIYEPVCEHLDELMERGPVVEHRRPELSSLPAPETFGGQGPADEMVSFGGKSRAAVWECAVPEHAAEAIVSFRLCPRAEIGQYVQVEARQEDQIGTLSGRTQTAVLGPRLSGRPAVWMIHLEGKARRLRLTFANAYSESPLSASPPEFTFLAATDQQPHGFPAGRVGLISAGLESLPMLMDDMITHDSYYRRTAADFSSAWRESHDPRRTIETLDANSQSTWRQAASA
jgi:hypothetical protein